MILDRNKLILFHKDKVRISIPVDWNGDLGEVGIKLFINMYCNEDYNHSNYMFYNHITNHIEFYYTDIEIINKDIKNINRDFKYYESLHKKLNLRSEAIYELNMRIK